MKTSILLAVRFTSVPVGFIAAVSFMRAINRSFDFYFSWMLRFVLSGIVHTARPDLTNLFRFQAGPSALLLLVCLVGFTLSIVMRKNAPAYPLRRVDYSVLLIICASVFFTCSRLAFGMASSMAFPGWMWQSTLFVFVLTIPFIAYLFALIAFGELAARLRDRTFIKTLYWVEFFKVYSPWRIIGLLAVLLLAAQVVVLVVFANLIIVMVAIVFSISSLTYYAVHMINLSAEYDIAAADKIRSERFKSELITNVSHDIRTPLTSIINYVDLLQGEELAGQAAGYVDVLARKSARLKVLIDDLMEASKAGTGNVRVDLQEINLSEMVGQVAGEFEDAFADNGLTLVIRQPGAENEPSPVIIQADSRHLYRAIENLFANAAKYGLGGTRVFAEVVPIPSESRAMFALQNTSALPIEMSGKDLTEQFIRGEKARNTEGSGLGLYIAKSLVELMGGKLDIHVIGDLFRVEVVV